jgi:hypothetical protein
MINVLFIDRAWPLLAELVGKFAELTHASGVNVLLLSEFKPTGICGNIETINIHDIPQRKSLIDLQKTYSFSLHKTLVTERSFYDYCSFRRSQSYSRLTEDQIAEKITPYANAMDFVIRERADIIIDWLQDSFVPSMAGPIAGHYNKPFKMFLPHYWWSDGALLLDRMDLTSTVIDKNYLHYYRNPELCDRIKLDAIFKTKKTLFVIKRSKMYSLSHRVTLFRNRLKSYEPISLRNWVVRRASRVWSSVCIKIFIQREIEPRDEQFLIYPLQTSPEASILGTLPEAADQFNLIKNISMNLPYGVKLYVKEHPFDIAGAGLDLNFYLRLNALPNVRIVKGKSSLSKLTEHPGFIALVSLNGTAIIETAFKRRPVFIFGRSFYGLADCFLKPKNFDEFYELLNFIMRGNFKFDDQALYAMLMALDKSIVRADINLDVDNSTDLLNQLPKIWSAYVKSNDWVVTRAVAEPVLHNSHALSASSLPLRFLCNGQ